MGEQMRIDLVNYTGLGMGPDFAINLLLYTKNTRLSMDQDAWTKIAQMSPEEKEMHLEEMARTIPTSWEFIDYTFAVHNCSRAFTHQMVRTRAAVFQERTLRVVDVSENGTAFNYTTGPSIEKNSELQKIYQGAMQDIEKQYRALIDNGATVEDARGILPLNIHTAIVAKINMRTLAELNRKRVSSRVQGEYRQFVSLIKAKMLEVHPWTRIFLDRSFDRAALDLEEKIGRLDIPMYEKLAMIKLIDQMRTL